MKLSKKQIDLIKKNHKERLESQIKEYAEEFDIYTSTIEHLIFELEMIEEVWWFYSQEDIIEWLKEKEKDIEWFDSALSMCWK